MGIRALALAAASVACASGCSTIGDGSGDDARADGAPGGGDGGGGGEADAAPPLGPFGEPRLIALSDPAALDADPTMPDDARELYFVSNRTGSAGIDIWVTRRDSVDDDWGPAEPVPELNSADAEQDPEISPDGLTLHFNSTRVAPGAKGGFDLFVSTRDSRDDDWSPPELVLELNSADSDMAAVMNQEQTAIVFHRANAAGAYDLFTAEREAVGDDWSMPMALAGINTDDAQEADPWLSADGLTLYFNSNRTGGSGDSDIYRTTRLNTATVLFAIPDEVPEVNSEFHEANVALARGSRYLVMSSARSGNQELWEASR